MLTVYLCGVLVAAAVTIGSTIRFSDPGARVTALTRVSVAILAGVFWPVLAVGLLQAMGISLLARRRMQVAFVSAEPRTPEELTLTG